MQVTGSMIDKLKRLIFAFRQIGLAWQNLLRSEDIFSQGIDILVNNADVAPNKFRGLSYSYKFKGAFENSGIKNRTYDINYIKESQISLVLNAVERAYNDEIISLI